LVRIASGFRTHVGLGYLLGGLLMLAGALSGHFIGIDAAGKSLERVGAPAFMLGKERFSAPWSFYIFAKAKTWNSVQIYEVIDTHQCFALYQGTTFSRAVKA
jgi:hypothetical protein